MPIRKMQRWWTRVALWFFDRPVLLFTISILCLAILVGLMYSGTHLLGQRLDAAIGAGDSTRELVDSTRALADTTRQIQRQQTAHSESLEVAYSRLDSVDKQARRERQALRAELQRHEKAVIQATRAEIDTLRVRERIARDQQVQAIKNATRKRQ